MRQKLVVAGGGTGGHFYPAVAVAEEWLSRFPEGDVLFIGTERGIEAKEAARLNFRLRLLNVLPLKRLTLKQKLSALFILPLAIWNAYKILKEEQPAVVVSAGGYSAGPVGLAAWLRHIPLALLEQNSIPGFTNKILARVASIIFLAFEATKKYLPQNRSMVVGNPLRKYIRTAIEKRNGFVNEKPVLFVTGGSQGAVAVNQLVLSALELMKEDAKNIKIVHQCGEADYETVKRRYSELGINAEVYAFIPDMVMQLCTATLVVARSGATTLAEIQALGIPAIYIPFPFAADDHQRINAREAEIGGAAIVLDQYSTDAQVLAKTIKSVVFDEERRKKMAEASKKLGRPEAAQAVVNHLTGLIK